MPKLLLVEDEPTVRNLLCQLLSAYECVPVRTAEEGLALLSSEAFDVAITDINLPGMSGEEFFRIAREIRPRLPVIVITGADGDEAKFMEAGAFGYLLKPFQFAEVEEMVERAVNK